MPGAVPQSGPRGKALWTREGGAGGGLGGGGAGVVDWSRSALRGPDFAPAPRPPACLAAFVCVFHRLLFSASAPLGSSRQGLEWWLL